MDKSCKRCGFRSASIAHTRVCKKVPPPKELIVEFTDENLTVHDLSAKYGVGEAFIRRHLEMGGADSTAKNYRYSKSDLPRCRRCTILIIPDGYNLSELPSSFSLENQRDVRGYCPGCASFNENGHEPVMGSGLLSLGKRVSMARVKSAV